MKQSPQWTCSFWGKHPAFSDYIRVNADETLFYALVQWLGKRRSGSDEPVYDGNNGHVSYFWIVPPNTVQLTCGLLMTSADSQGRPSSVLCALKGTLPVSPQRYWERIHLYCQATWQDMAKLPAYRFSSFSEFKTTLSRITPPDFKPRSDCPEESRMIAIKQAVSVGMMSNQSRFIREKMLHFSVDDDNPGDWVWWARAIREAVDVMPCSLFVRNAGVNKQLYLYYRPLTAADFQMMQNGK